MKRNALVLSAVVLTIVSFGIGYGVNELTGPGLTESQNRAVESESDQAKVDQTMSRDEGFSLDAEFDRALEQVSSLQSDLDQALADLRVAEEALLVFEAESPGEVGADRTETPEEKYARWQAMMNDPDIQQVMRAESRRSMSDPERQKRLRQRRELDVQKTYADLFRKLNFTDEQAEEFITLLVDHDLARNTGMLQLDLSADERRLQHETRKEQLDQRIQDLFGSDFQAYKEYRDTLQVRLSLPSYTSFFREPLDDYVKDELIRIMYEEMQTRGPTGYDRNMDSEARSNAVKTSLALHRRYDENVIERARAYLTEQQLSSLKKGLAERWSQSGTKIMFQETTRHESGRVDILTSIFDSEADQ